MPTEPAIAEWPLPYIERLDLRDPADVELLVVHCTELPDLALAREYGERVLHPSTGTGNSGHYYIDRDGATYRFVPASRVAHHVRGLNARSLGIELVNRGRWPDWLDSRRQAMEEPYAEAQLAAFVALVAQLRQELPNLATIAGHEDLDLERVASSDDPSTTVPRKRDPGPLFPWPRIVVETGLRRVP